MSIPSDQFTAIEATLNRLATESILAVPGRDEGLVPSYSLLGELRDQLEQRPDLRDPVAALQRQLEQLLDAAKPFDDVTLGALHRLVEWLPGALAQGGATKPGAAPAPAAPLPAAAPAVAAVPVPASAGGVSGDLLLELHLEDNRELLVEFHGEAVDHLQQIEAALLALDHEPEDPEALNSIFRSFHTIKGNAGFLGLVPMHTLAHEVESLLDLARNRKLQLTAPIVTEILRSRDALAALTQQISVALEQGRIPDQVIPVNHLIRAVKALAAGETVRAEPTAAPVLAAVEPFAPAATPVTPVSGPTVPEAAPSRAAAGETPKPASGATS